MAWPAASPKIQSGSRSGVTSVTVASRTLRVSRRGHDRELVGGQRPGRAGRHDDHELAGGGRAPPRRATHSSMGTSAGPRKVSEPWRAGSGALRPRPAGGRSRDRRRSRGERAGRRRPRRPARPRRASRRTAVRARAGRAAAGRRGRTASRPTRACARGRARAPGARCRSCGRREWRSARTASTAATPDPAMRTRCVMRTASRAPVVAHIRPTPPPVARRTTEPVQQAARMAAARRPRTVAACSSAAASAIRSGPARHAAAASRARWTGRPCDDSHWHIELRCGDCGHRWELDVPRLAAARFDVELDGDRARSAARCRRLDLERMAAEVETFAAALSRDLIEPADFAA